jgi:hypothetical protein
MILVFEMVWTGTHYAPGNSAAMAIIAVLAAMDPARYARPVVSGFRSSFALASPSGI